MAIKQCTAYQFKIQHNLALKKHTNYSIFQETGIGKTSTANQFQVQFLDVTLKNENYKPYLKPEDKPCYVNSESNHPPAIIRNIPLSINKRLSKISSNKEIFDNAAPIYQAELTKNGYHHTLEFDQTATTNRRKTRHIKVIYFNPPYFMNVKINIGAKLLRLLDQHFPPGSLLYPLLNRRKVKLSYRCLPNLKAQLAKHNFNILNQTKMSPLPSATVKTLQSAHSPANAPLTMWCMVPRSKQAMKFRNMLA